MLVLATLTEGPLHGYAVIQSLRKLSGRYFDLPEGTVYPVLHRLERAGFLSSRWSAEFGRRRRVYQLTRSGRAEIKQQTAEWTAFSRAVTEVVGAVT